MKRLFCAWVFVLLAASACSERPEAIGGIATELGANWARSLEQRLSLAMAAPNRPVTDKELDGTRKPIEVLEFIGVDSGMTVLDVSAGSGYYAELLAAAVGPRGVVYAQNDVSTLERQDGEVEHALDRRLAANRLPNVFRLDEDLENLALEQQFDAGFLMLTLHDLYTVHGEAHTTDLLRRIRRALKPGAVLGVVDHVGDASRSLDSRALHRIEEETAVRLLETAGFTIEARSDVLANPDDPRDRNVFDESIRNRTDRFTLRARA